MQALSIVPPPQTVFKQGGIINQIPVFSAATVGIKNKVKVSYSLLLRKLFTLKKACFV